MRWLPPRGGFFAWSGPGEAMSALIPEPASELPFLILGDEMIGRRRSEKWLACI